MRPDLTGRGLGEAFTRAALEFDHENYRPVKAVMWETQALPREFLQMEMLGRMDRD